MDNIEILKNLLYFNDDFYHRFQIIARKHKNASLNKSIRCVHIGSYDALNDNWENMKAEADKYNARIYVNLVPIRLHEDYLRCIYPKVDRVYGAKEPQTSFQYPKYYYVVYDADEGHEEKTKQFINHLKDKKIEHIIINSSKNGKHILIKNIDVNKIDKIFIKNLHIDFANALAYNPHC